MQTACNTPATPRIQLQLPSLDDPSLNTPTITAQLPDASYQMYRPRYQPEALPTLEDLDLDLPPERKPFPDTPLGHLASLVAYERGTKLLGCRDGGFVFKYPCGKRRWREAYPCKLGILCFMCAQDAAEEQFDKYKHLESFIIGRHFTRITIPISDSPREEYNSLMEFLSQFPKAATLTKIKPVANVIEVIYCAALGNSELSQIREAWPSATARRYCQSNFLRELHAVLDAVAFETPELAAAADAKYFKINLLRLQGLSQEERKNLSLLAVRNKFPKDDESSPGGDGSGPSLGGEMTSLPPKKYFHRTRTGHLMPVPACSCPCGAAPTHIARGKSIHDDSPDMVWTELNIYTEEQAKQLKMQTEVGQ